MIEWELIAKKLNYESTEAMLRDMRDNKNLSTNEMARIMAKTKIDSPTSVSIRTLCKKLNIKLKPPGGANHRGLHITVNKMLDNAEKIKNMDAVQAAKFIGIDPNHFMALAKVHNVEYIRRKKVKNE